MQEASGDRAKRGSDGARIKLENSHAVDESWLTDFEGETTDYLRRLETDRTIIAELRSNKFEGAHYAYFTSELAKYGIAVITAWIRTQQIFPKMRQRGFGGLPQPRADLLRVQETAQELAMETVAFAIDNFRTHVLIPGKWDPGKGASIRTYFVGQCLIQFSNVYRRWHKEVSDNAPWGHLVNEAAITARGYDHVEDRVEVLTRTEALLSSVKKDRTKEVLVLRGAGHTQEEIAVRLRISLKTVEMIVSNERRRQMKGLAG